VGSGLCEVSFADLESGQRRAECRERLIDQFCICAIGSDQHVQVLGRARVPVEGDYVSTQHDERSARVTQGEQQISKIFGKLGQVARPGTNLIGMLARVHVGCGAPARL